MKYIKLTKLDNLVVGLILGMAIQSLINGDYKLMVMQGFIVGFGTAILSIMNRFVNCTEGEKK